MAQFLKHLPLIALLCFGLCEASVLRTTTEVTKIQSTTPSSQDNLKMNTTTERSQDTLATTTVMAESLMEEEKELAGGLTKDEEASLLIVDQTLLDPAPAELKQQTEIEALQAEPKSGKLLLLSTPKLSPKPKETSEESEEESAEDGILLLDDKNEDTVKESQTEVAVKKEDTKDDKKTETQTKQEEESKTATTQSTADLKETQAAAETSSSSTTLKTTKLFPINDTLYEDNKKAEESPSTSTLASTVTPLAGTTTTTTTTTTPRTAAFAIHADEQPQEETKPVANLQTVIITEDESDYILHDAETLEGHYADEDSELHLQPIVQSVEIVPSSFDDPLLVNYVHSW